MMATRTQAWSTDDYEKVDIADRFLLDLRFGLDRSESTIRVCAGELSRFLGWCAQTGRDLEGGVRHLRTPLASSAAYVDLRTVARRPAGRTTSAFPRDEVADLLDVDQFDCLNFPSGGASLPPKTSV